jgi:hypothetical protein
VDAIALWAVSPGEESYLGAGTTCLTWMADAEVPVHVLRKIAGHGSLTTAAIGGVAGVPR